MESSPRQLVSIHTVPPVEPRTFAQVQALTGGRVPLVFVYRAHGIAVNDGEAIQVLSSENLTESKSEPYTPSQTVRNDSKRLSQM